MVKTERTVLKESQDLWVRRVKKERKEKRDQRALPAFLVSLAL